MNTPVRLVLAACALALSVPAAASNAPRADCPIRIAVAPFALAPGSPRPPLDVAAAVSSDLAASECFAPVAEKELPARPAAQAEVRYEDWRRARVDYVVVGLVGKVHDGGHELEFRVLDTRQEQAVFGFIVPSAPDELRGTARRIATLIEERLIGTRPPEE